MRPHAHASRGAAPAAALCSLDHPEDPGAHPLCGRYGYKLRAAAMHTVAMQHKICVSGKAHCGAVCLIHPTQKANELCDGDVQASPAMVTVSE